MVLVLNPLAIVSDKSRRLAVSIVLERSVAEEFDGGIFPGHCETHSESSQHRCLRKFAGIREVFCHSNAAVSIDIEVHAHVSIF